MGAALLRRGVFALFILFARGCVSPVLISYPRLSGGQASKRYEYRRSVPLGRAPFWTFARRSGTVHQGTDLLTTGRDVDSTCQRREPASLASISRARPRAQRPMLSSRMPKPSSRSPADERERTRTGTHRRGQKLVRKLLQGHHDQRSPGQAAGPAEDASGVECSARREQDSHAETTSGTMQVVGLGCARRGHDGLHPLDAALNLLPERSLNDMRRSVTIATASRAPPRTPWKPSGTRHYPRGSGDAACGARRPAH